MAFDKMIFGFKGKYYFLSNFYSAPVTYHGITYQNSEAAFHAQKDPSRSNEFANLNPSQAKKLGRRVNLRSDWEQVKDRIMYEIVLLKFTQNPELRQKLLETNDSTLVEANTWHDSYWGYDEINNCGLNRLGKILMSIRDEFKAEARKGLHPFGQMQKILYDADHPHKIYKLTLSESMFRSHPNSVYYVEADEEDEVLQRYNNHIGFSNMYPVRVISIQQVQLEDVDSTKFIKYDPIFTEAKRRMGE